MDGRELEEHCWTELKAGREGGLTNEFGPSNDEG